MGEIAISGVLGPAAAQSAVRQAVLAELRRGALSKDGKPVGESVAHESEGGKVEFARGKEQVARRSSGLSRQDHKAGHASLGGAVPAAAGLLQGHHGPDSRAEVHKIPTAISSEWTCVEPEWSPSSSDAEEEKENRALRDGRLDQL